MADGGNRTAVVWGIFFIVAGIAFLLDRLDVWTLRARYVLPLLLIVLGAAILLGGRGWVRGGRG
jgi:cytochrome c oxidase subunit IV